MIIADSQSVSPRCSHWSQIKNFCSFHGFSPGPGPRPSQYPSFSHFSIQNPLVLCADVLSSIIRPSPVTVTSFCPAIVCFHPFNNCNVAGDVSFASLAHSNFHLSLDGDWGIRTRDSKIRICRTSKGVGRMDTVCFADCLQLIRNPLTVGHICAFAELILKFATF